MGGLHRNSYGEIMPRRSSGPKLKFFPNRNYFYIVWTENGRSRERSTYTSDSAEAQIIFAQFLQRFTQKLGARDPSEVLVTDILTAYLERLETTGKDGERAGMQRSILPNILRVSHLTMHQLCAKDMQIGVWYQQVPCDGI